MGRHPWPGNVRELRTVVESAALAEKRAAIGVGVLPAEIRLGPRPASDHAPSPAPELTFREALDRSQADAARRYLEAVLTEHRGDVVAGTFRQDDG